MSLLKRQPAKTGPALLKSLTQSTQKIVQKEEPTEVPGPAVVQKPDPPEQSAKAKKNRRPTKEELEDPNCRWITRTCVVQKEGAPNLGREYEVWWLPDEGEDPLTGTGERGYFKRFTDGLGNYNTTNKGMIACVDQKISLMNQTILDLNTHVGALDTKLNAVSEMIQQALCEAQEDHMDEDDEGFVVDGSEDESSVETTEEEVKPPPKKDRKRKKQSSKDAPSSKRRKIQ
jgi:hypothetical protein